MNESIAVDLIHAVERGVEHHNRLQQWSLARLLFARELGGVKTLSSPPFGLLRIASATPPEIDGIPTNVRIFDDNVAQFDPSRWDTTKRPDIVGISCTTAAQYRAEYLIREAQRREIQVVLGGPHTSVDTQSAL
jgi:hypothetical protein